MADKSSKLRCNYNDKYCTAVQQQTMIITITLNNVCTNRSKGKQGDHCKLNSANI